MFSAFQTLQRGLQMVHKLMESLVHPSCKYGSYFLQKPMYTTPNSCTNCRQPYRLVCICVRPTPREEAAARHCGCSALAAEPSPCVLAAGRANQPPAVSWGAAAACFKQQIPRSSLQRQTTTCLRQSLCGGKAAPAAAVVPHAAQRRSVPACCAAAAAASPGAKQDLLGLLEVLDQVGHICFVWGGPQQKQSGSHSTAQHSTPRSALEQLVSSLLLRCHWRA